MSLLEWFCLAWAVSMLALYRMASRAPLADEPAPEPPRVTVTYSGSPDGPWVVMDGPITVPERHPASALRKGQQN